MVNHRGRMSEIPIPKEDLKPLNSKQNLFCYEYLQDRNGTQAAIRAGYSTDSAKEIASENLTKPNIKAKINKLIKEQLDSLKVDSKLILREILNAAMVNIADAYDENGKLKDLCDMPESLQKAITSVEINELYDGTGKDREQIGYTKKIKIDSRLKALELLGKNKKLFTDILKVDGIEDLAEQMKAGRKRVSKCRKTKT